MTRWCLSAARSIFFRHFSHCGSFERDGRDRGVVCRALLHGLCGAVKADLEGGLTCTSYIVEVHLFVGRSQSLSGILVSESLPYIVRCKKCNQYRRRC